MKKLILTNLLLITAIVISAQHKDSPKFIGPYLGQKPPGMVPEIFAPDFISTKEYGELNAGFTKDGNEFYFSRRGVPENNEQLWLPDRSIAIGVILNQYLLWYKR